MKRHELWRAHYRGNRYMRPLSDLELDQRFDDCLSNQLILTQEGKIGMSGIEWLERGTHVLEEFQLRGRGLPAGDGLERRFQIPRPHVGLELAQQVRADFPSGIPEEFTLFKYGKIKHLQAFFERGVLRLSPASAYDDPSLNPAIEDKELELEKVVGDQRSRYVARSDYYCYCSSWLHGDRLIGDFDADCVVAITDPHEFFVRLATALDEPNYELSFNRVTYVDPLLLGDRDVRDVAYVKHLRFAYQFEHRFVAYPPSVEEMLEVRHLRLGSLHDIARLYGV